MLKYLTLLEILGLAAWMDLQKGRISNRLIVMGMGLGLMFQLEEHGVIGSIIFLKNISFPVIVFYLLFLMHALGAGDIKLFSVIGSFLNFKGLCCCIILAFLLGGLWSFVRLLKRDRLFSGMLELLQYTKETLRTGQVHVYKKKREKGDLICFALPILGGYLCYLLEVAY